MKPRLIWYGPWTQMSGYGSAARDHLLALARTGRVDLRLVAPTDASAILPRYEELLPFCHEDPLSELDWPTHVLLHAPPHQLHPSMENIIFQHEGAKRILMTTWETDRVNPKFLWDFEMFDKIWVPSHYNRIAVETLDELPGAKVKGVCVVPHPHDPDFWQTRPLPSRPEPLLFYCIGTWGIRKNLLGVVHAFLAEFHQVDPVELHLLIPGKSQAQAEEEIATWASHSGITNPAPVRVFGQRVTDVELRQFHYDRHVYVSLARGEGFGLGVYEACLVGNRVISVDWGGPEDWVADGFGVDCFRTPAFLPEPPLKFERDAAGKVAVTRYRPDDGGITAKQFWAEPDLSAAMRMMRHCIPTPTKTLTPSRLTYKPSYTYEAVGNQMADLIEAL